MSASESVGKVIGSVFAAVGIAVLAIGAIFAGVAVLEKLAPSRSRCPSCRTEIPQGSNPCPNCLATLRWEKAA
jgi:hypothetical protein